MNCLGPGPWFNIKMTSYQYRKSHCGDKTILRPSYLHNGFSYTGKTTSLYWIRAQMVRNELVCMPATLCSIYCLSGWLLSCWSLGPVEIRFAALTYSPHNKMECSSSWSLPVIRPDLAGTRWFAMRYFVCQSGSTLSLYTVCQAGY